MVLSYTQQQLNEAFEAGVTVGGVRRQPSNIPGEAYPSSSDQAPCDPRKADEPVAPSLNKNLKKEERAGPGHDPWIECSQCGIGCTQSPCLPCSVKLKKAAEIPGFDQRNQARWYRNPCTGCGAAFPDHPGSVCHLYKNKTAG
jgi:hypothetical protein